MLNLVNNLKLVVVCILISTALGNTISEVLGVMWSLGYFLGFYLENVQHTDRESLPMPVSFLTTPYLCSEFVVDYLDKLFQLDK
ncbi:hypothetical protein [Adhaeribacter aquaticus]|uniref:hypothetical protein n=1 Tax=Adhaeribacter aquaticus TaxID=299567 RepID=UPI000401D58F|nr:hypothetical protein [Adhaeribacter aquaticus]